MLKVFTLLDIHEGIKVKLTTHLQHDKRAALFSQCHD